jgi:hypothetical protein
MPIGGHVKRRPLSSTTDVDNLPNRTSCYSERVSCGSFRGAEPAGLMLLLGVIWFVSQRLLPL